MYVATQFPQSSYYTLTQMLPIILLLLDHIDDAAIHQV